jgi:hypothetical protein
VGVVSVRGRAAGLLAWLAGDRPLFDAFVAMHDGCDESARARLSADPLARAPWACTTAR